MCREYKISKAAFSERFSERIRTVKKVANQIVETDRAIALLDVNERIAVFGLAEQLKQMSGHIASAGNDSAMVSKMFAKAARDATSKIMFKAMDDDGETISPERLAACTEEIAAVMKSTVVSNEASKVSLALLNANKETVNQINNSGAEDKPKTLMDFYGGQ